MESNINRLSIEGTDPNGDMLISADGLRGFGAVYDNGEAELEAAELVRRWNAYPDLLAALREIAEAANVEKAGERLTGAYRCIADLEDIARAAIGKANA